MVECALAGRCLSRPVDLDAAPAALVAVAGDHSLTQCLIAVVALALAAPLDVGARPDMHEVRVLEEFRLPTFRSIGPLE